MVTMFFFFNQYYANNVFFEATMLISVHNIIKIYVFLIIQTSLNSVFYFYLKNFLCLILYNFKKIIFKI